MAWLARSLVASTMLLGVVTEVCNQRKGGADALGEDVALLQMTAGLDVKAGNAEKFHSAVESTNAEAPQNYSGETLLFTLVVGSARAAGDFSKVFAQSFTLTAAAEAFDRTWFLTLICSLHHGPVVSFLASFGAMAVHSVLAVSFGESASRLLPTWALELISGILLAAFAAVYAWESYQAGANQDAIKTRMEEVEADAPTGNPQAGEEAAAASAGDAGEVREGGSAKGEATFWVSFVAVFSAIFLAGWGDRNQLVQITLAASHPAAPVFLGSLAALCLLCLSAAALARFMGDRQVNERVLNILCVISFGVMSLLAFYNARREYLGSAGADA